MRNRQCAHQASACVWTWVVALACALAAAVLPPGVAAQLRTTTVQGTIYRADGTPASGTLLVSWPAFTTPQNQAIAAGNTSAKIGADGFVSVNLTPNAGSLPSGNYYTAVYHLADGTVNQEYWIVPAAGTASVAAVRAQLQPSTIAVQPVSQSYVDSAVASLTGSWLPLTGGSMNGPLTLSSDPTGNSQAATKHYADQLAAAQLPLAGGTLNGPLTVPKLTVNGQITASLALTDLGRTHRVSVKECGAQGNSTVGSDGNDDTAAIIACVAKLCTEGGGTLFFPAGIYRTTANIPLACSNSSGLWGAPMIRLEGDSETTTGIVMTNATQPLLSIWKVGATVKLANLTLYGLGASTRGTLLENFAPWTALDHVTFNGTGGVALLQDNERQYLNNVKFLNVRQAWVLGSHGKGNESYSRNMEALNYGATTNPFGGGGTYSYDVNAVNGVLPAANKGPQGGPTPLIQDTHAAFVLGAVNDKIDGCSIKGASDISALRVIYGENMEISHCYFEGWTANSGGGITGLGENLSIINGGYNVRAAATTALHSTTVPTGPTNDTPLTAWSATLDDGRWFRNNVGFTNELNYGDGWGSASDVATIIPPDFSWTDCSASSIGGGILKCNYETVALAGVVNNTIYISARGVNSTAQYNWPAGALYVEDDTLNDSNFISDALILTDNHYASHQLLSGYTITANPDSGEPNGVEIVNGVMPDAFDNWGMGGHAPFNAKKILFLGNNRFRTQKLEAHGDSRISVEGGDGTSLWTNTAPGFDVSPMNLGELGGLTINSVTYANGSTSHWAIRRGGYGYSDSGRRGNFRDYFGTVSAAHQQIHQFANGYALCDSSGTGNVPAFCNYLDNTGVWKRTSYDGSSFTPQGGYAQTDTSGNLALAGSISAQSITGATINGEITVDGTTYTNLNAAWSAALNQANSSGHNQAVRLGPGTFPVTATLNEPSNGACVSLLGSGGTTVNADSPQVATTLTIPSSLGGDVFYLGNTAQAQGCTFKDLNILAGGKATHGFELQWFRGTLIDNVTVNDTTAEGVLLGEGNTSSGHQSNFLLRNVTVSYSSAAFTPANRSAYGIHLLKTAMDSQLDNILVRNALTAAVYNEGSGNTGDMIHGFGFPYTCTTAPCANNASSSTAANASWATSYVIYDTGGAGSVWTDTYVDSPAVAGFYVGANGVAIHGGHIQWPDYTSFPAANLAYVAPAVTNNLLIADVDCLGMAPSVNWITYAGASGNPPTYAGVHHLTGCGNYYQALEDANTTGFSSGGANINDPTGAVPRVWSTPVASAASYPAYSAQLYNGYQGDAFQAHFSGVNPFFNVTYQGTIRSSGGLALSTVINTASTLTLTTANKNVIANAAGGPQTITLPSCYTPLPDKAAPTGLEFTIIKSDTSANAVTLQAVSSQNINYNGATAQTLSISAAGKRTLVCAPDYNWYAY